MEREIEELKDGQPAKPEEPRLGEVKEYGLSEYLLKEQKLCMDKLKAVFPHDWSRIVSLAYCRLRFQSPMRRVAGDFADSFLSRKIGERGLSANALSGFLHDLGARRDKITEFMRSYIDPDDNIIFDGTDQLSASRCMDFPQLTKTNKGAFDTAVNIMWIFNCAKHLPVYYRLLPGSIKDVSAFKVCVEDSGMRSGVAIIDKGFQSVSNIEKLDELGIKFIMSLKRSTKGLDYSVFASRTNEVRMERSSITSGRYGGDGLRLKDMRCSCILMRHIAATSRRTICGVFSILTLRGTLWKIIKPRHYSSAHWP